MKIYNTLTKQKEEFVPIEEGKVRMYVCGPTVYDLMHIGNARPQIVFDTVRRFLEYKGYEVNYVSNFTDVDDKIIKRANEENKEAKELSEHYIQEAKKDMEGMNVRPATVHPKATEEIEPMITMIQTLIEKGHAYEKNGTVYFRTRSFQNYGKLSGKNLDDLEAGARIAINEEKEDPMDFVLWKPKKEKEPFWTSPWGEGRPGWHMECSVMSKKYLGEEIDIHAGGQDLIFPHHENEIAQSEAASGKKFSRYWMHNGYLTIENRKMGKSLGNFLTIRDVSEKYSLQVLRFFMLSAHYRSPVNFSEELMEAAKNGLTRIITAVDNLNYLIGVAEEKEAIKEEKQILEQAKELEEKLEQAMEDDFNTADAIAAIFELVKLANSTLSAKNSKTIIVKIKDQIVTLCDILGLVAEVKKESLNEKVEQMIAMREEARKQKDYKKADAIRKKLAEMGILLEDTREGVKWKKA